MTDNVYNTIRSDIKNQSIKIYEKFSQMRNINVIGALVKRLKPKKKKQYNNTQTDIHTYNANIV